MTAGVVEKRAYRRHLIRCQLCNGLRAACYADADVCYACHVDEVAKAVRKITRGVLAAVKAWNAAHERTTCMACGCLVLLDEHCPGCRARRLNAVPD